MHTHKHIIANWKMYLRFTQMVNWCNEHYDTLHDMSQYVHLGITPEATAIAAIQDVLRGIPSIMVGGQTCSHHHLGARTGEVSAQSLADIGCDICLAGHSEQRAYHGITSDDVAEQVNMLLQHRITPIVCIGETEQERAHGATMTVIQQQLDPVIPYLNHHEPAYIYIAYEPRWAIGSGTTATHSDIIETANVIRTHMHKQTDVHPYILYGGSVSPSNSESLAQIDEIDGFLVGSASRDFTAFQQIIRSAIKTGK